MLETLIPLLLVLGSAIILPKWSPTRPVLTAFVTLAVVLLLARYLTWRVTETVLPASGSIPEIVFVWLVFVCEVWLWYETTVLCLLLLRRVDRSPEADAHEARLRTLPADALPAVDVLIATYNEPLDVLEKTIAGALALDWPEARLTIYVLDDGRRDWLAEYCAEQGVVHLTRPDNAHAKAGNINAAIPRTTAPFLLILDADFVPQRQMLMRAMGFFQDPKVGIVQMPHHFFNSTPLQTNTELRAALPDEQRFFFDVIQPGRDGWDCAFCCGSNGILRRSAVEAIGGGMPTDSITEDMLLTLAMMRKGYVTRYLGERLAIGLAPESLDAYFVQRERWARGAIQLFYTPLGPLGPGLTPLQRVFFNPSHWLSLSICQPLAMATPAIFLLTGWPPLVNADLAEIASYQLPAIAAGMCYLGFLAPSQFAPVAATVESVMQSFRLMPSVLWTLVKPHGHAFRVTPKGSGAALGREDRFTAGVCISIISATALGLILNSDLNWRLVGNVQLLPIVAFWSIFNMIVLLIVMTAGVPRPSPRSEERFPLERPCRLMGEHLTHTGETRDVSLSGARIDLHPSSDLSPLSVGSWCVIELAGIGPIAAEIKRTVTDGDRTQIGVAFHAPTGEVRRTLLQELFASGLDGGVASEAGFGLFPLLILRTLTAPDVKPDQSGTETHPPCLPPAWVTERLLDAVAPNIEGSRDAPHAL